LDAVKFKIFYLPMALKYLAKDTQRRHVQKRDLTLTPCLQKLVETIEIKSTKPNQKYGQLSDAHFQEATRKKSVAFYLNR
jgi:hypothetical protein